MQSRIYCSMSSACIRMSRPTRTRRSSLRSSMRRMVFIDTRSAIAASAMVIKEATDNGLVPTALPSAGPGEGCDAGPGGAGSGSWCRSNVSAAQAGILPSASDVDSESLFRRHAAGRSSTRYSARALPMPLYYSTTRTSPIPKPREYVGRIRHQGINTSRRADIAAVCARNQAPLHEQFRIMRKTYRPFAHVRLAMSGIQRIADSTRT